MTILGQIVSVGTHKCSYEKCSQDANIYYYNKKHGDDIWVCDDHAEKMLVREYEQGQNRTILSKIKGDRQIEELIAEVVEATIRKISNQTAKQ